jgi:hypothetical protein
VAPPEDTAAETAEEDVDTVEAGDSEVEGELVDVPDELKDIDEDGVDDAEEESGAGDTAAEDTEATDEAGTAAEADVVTPVAKAKAGKSETKAKTAKSVKPPRVKAAEKKAKKTGPAPRKMPKQRRWVAPLMLACWLIGLAWLVVFYVAGNDIPYMRDLGNWNLLVGMGLIALGFVVSTQWV